MAAPNIESSTNPTSTGGNASGVVVGESTSQTLGFFGNTGTTQPTSASITDYASLKAALQAMGLIGS